MAVITAEATHLDPVGGPGRVLEDDKGLQASSVVIAVDERQVVHPVATRCGGRPWGEVRRSGNMSCASADAK